MSLSETQLDRARGVLVGQAVGDALGQPFEFDYAIAPAGPISMVKGTWFGLGEWTDDTSQAVAIALALVEHGPGEAAFDKAVSLFYKWHHEDPRDIGVQTSGVMSSALNRTGRGLREAAAEYLAENKRAQGNGSLMRTGPVALAFLDGGAGLMQAAKGFSELTHAAEDCWQACYIWSEAIRGAVLNGKFDGLWLAIERLEPASRDLWTQRMKQAETADLGDLRPNGYVVTAIQLAWGAISQTMDAGEGQYRAAVEACIRVGDDADTTAAICGALVGARWGDSNIPVEWSNIVRGWPNYKVADLRELATSLALSSFGN